MQLELHYIRHSKYSGNYLLYDRQSNSCSAFTELSMFNDAVQFVIRKECCYFAPDASIPFTVFNYSEGDDIYSLFPELCI